MSMARHKAKGPFPTEVYVVSYGNSHKLYSSLSAAKGVRTAEKKWNKEVKIYRLVVAWEEEVEE